MTQDSPPKCCPACGTTIQTAPGIGPFCPNLSCRVGDGPFGVPIPGLGRVNVTQHDHTATANHVDSFLTFKGDTVRGVVRGSRGYMLTFECGWALVFNSGGAFWVANPEEVNGVLDGMKREIQNAGELG